MINKVPAADARTAIFSLTGEEDTADSAKFNTSFSSHTDRTVAVLASLNDCRRMLIRNGQEKTLLEAICKTLVDSGCYQMAWFGFALPDDTKKARRAGRMQLEAGYPEKVKAIWSAKEQTRTEERALRTRHPQVIQDVFSPVHTLQWEEQAIKYNFTSVISLPLTYEEDAFGTLNLYANEKNAFDTAEVNALAGLAEDIACSLQQLRVRVAQQQNFLQLYISEKYFHALIEHSSDIIMVVNAAGIPAFVSPSMQRMLGYSPADTAGKTILHYVHPEDKKTIKALLATLTITSGLQKKEARFIHKNGTLMYFDCTISNQIQEPDIQGLVITLHDITSLKEAQAKLLQQQQEQQIIFDSVPAIITFKDTYNRVLRVNHMAASFYGLPKEDIEGKSMYDLNPLFAAKYHKEDIEIITSGESRLNVIEKVMLGNGQTKWLQTEKIPYYDDRGKTTGIIIFAKEITAQRRTEEELRSALEELKRRNYELDNYFYKVSHDLRSPLCSIEGLINLMKTEQDTAVSNLYLELIEKSVRKLDNFIKTILNHSNAIHTASQSTKIDFTHIFNDCLEELKYVPEQARVKATLHLSASGSFYNDPTRIAIIFRNLISNGLKFYNPSADNSYLHIHISVTPAKAYITVEDNGAGIEKKYLNKVFNMFFKATDRSEGAGLGLYIVKQTVEKLEGSVSLKSETGKGSTFRVVLPNFQV
jgi:PAS domain S-box-containing protein